MGNATRVRCGQTVEKVDDAAGGATASSTSVDVIVPMRNEAKKLPAFVAMLRAQTLQPARIIVADGRSTDGSRELLESMAADLPGLMVVDNPRRVVPAALNVCLGHVSSALVARMDTHAEYAPDYLETVVAALTQDPALGGVGGAMTTAGRGPWGSAIASTLSRPFGLGGARHRVGGAAGPIPHVFSGCYRTEVLREVGGWDERFHANEDFETDTRIVQSGRTLWLEPAATSTWFVRDTPAALALQMWRYGYYKGLTLNLHPRAVKARQTLPPLLVLTLALGAVVAPRPTALGAAAYAAVAATLGGRAAAADGADPWRGALIPPVVHLCWGSGLLVGVVRFARSSRR